MSLHSTVLAEFQQPSTKVWPTIEVVLPSGTQRWCSEKDTSVNSDELGTFIPRVKSWGSITQKASGWLGGLEAMEMTINIADTDKSFSREQARSGRRLRRAAATFRLLSSAFTVTNSFTINLQLATWKQADDLSWNLTFRPNDRWVMSNLLKVPILKNDWPNALPDVYAESEPVVYGIHDSRGSTSMGAIPLFSVDTVGLRYLVSRGWIVSVDRVYADGVLMGMDKWTESKVAINHRLRTVVTLHDDPIPAQTGQIVKISADVHGIESVGDGSGTLLENPVTILRHALTNFGWNQYKEGLWFAESGTPLDSDLFDAVAAFCELKGHKASRRFSAPALEDEKNYLVSDLLQEICLSFGLRCWWTWAGKIGLGVYRDHRVPVTPRSWVKWDLHELGPAPIDYDDTNPVTHLTGKFLFMGNEKYIETLEVINTDVDPSDAISQSLEFRASYASVV